MIPYYPHLSQEGIIDVLNMREFFANRKINPSIPTPKEKYRIEHILKFMKAGLDRTGNHWERVKSMTQYDKVKIFIDSGAPSLYNALVRRESGGAHTHMGTFLKDRKYDNFDFLETKEYRVYRRRYTQFIKEYLPYVEVYAVLDVINNAEATWENQQYMESKGLKPIPVWHFGCDEKWLEMYLEKDYNYIAIGGLVPNDSSVIIPPLDDIWEYLLTYDNGMPRVKVHGFAVTALDLFFRYPWYSVDSASWVKYGKFGIALVPRKERGHYDYTLSAHKVAVSDRSPYKELQGKHISNYPPAVRSFILDYFHEKGFRLGSCKYKTVGPGYELAENERFIAGRKGDEAREVEIEIEKGLATDYKVRDELNILFYLDMEKKAQEWPWPFKRQKASKRLGLV
jgi:hypothetical protein